MFFVLQSENKPMKPSRHRRNLSVLLAHLVRPKMSALPKPLAGLVSSLPTRPPPLSFRTNIFLQTRFCSCGSCPRQLIQRASVLFLVASRGLRKFGWFLGGRGLLSSNMKMRLVLSARKKPHRECPWGITASPFGLPTRDSEVSTGDPSSISWSFGVLFSLIFFY